MRRCNLLALCFVCAACGVGTSATSTLPVKGYLVYVRDREGSVLAAVDDQGKTLSQTEDDGFGLRLTSTGTPVPREFLDKELDEETGYYHFHARYYDPATAQWISPDPKLLSNIDCSGLVQGCQPYAFAGNRPLEWTDEDGREVITFHDSSGVPTLLVTAAFVGPSAVEAQQVFLQQVTNIRSPVKIVALTAVYKDVEQVPNGTTIFTANAAIPRSDGKYSSDTDSDMTHIFLGRSALASGGENEMARGDEMIHELLHAAGKVSEGYLQLASRWTFSKLGHIDGYGGNYHDQPEQVSLTDTEAREVMAPPDPKNMNSGATANDPSLLSSPTFKTAVGGGNLPTP